MRSNVQRHSSGGSGAGWTESAANYLPAQGSMNLEFTQISDRGKVREGNEDYLGHVEPGTPEEARARGWLFALADGVGGHDLGEVASRTAIESVMAGFRAATPGEAHPALMTRLVRDANTHVSCTRRMIRARGGSNMATTIVAVRSAIRSRHGGPRRRFALLPRPARPGCASHTRSHRRERTRPTRNTVRTRSGRRRYSAHAEPLAGKRADRQRRYRGASGVCRRRAVALFRRASRLC